MARIAFFSIYAFGHTNPTLAVVGELTRRGHRVRYYSFSPFQKAIEAAGGEFVRCDAYLPPPPSDLDRQVGRDFAGLVEMITDTTLAMNGPIGRDLREFAPHCVVSDSLCFWGKLWSAKLGLPYVCSTTTFAFNRETQAVERQAGAALCVLHHHLRLQPGDGRDDEADAGTAAPPADGARAHPAVHGEAAGGGIPGEGPAGPDPEQQ